ncbi:MAG: DUF4469 domain-containing protein [Tannerella sp.]|jgi:hypothetical protein|nr:DUF4469 domain-containing protein [Tannerella sp.]
MEYFLINNYLTSDPNDQSAIPTGIRSYTDEQIIDRIMQRGTTLTRPDLPDDGVYFIDADGNEYKAITLVENKPSRLIVMLPALSSGSYALEVRTHFINSAVPGKQLRKAQYAKPLNM